MQRLMRGTIPQNSRTIFRALSVKGVLPEYFCLDSIGSPISFYLTLTKITKHTLHIVE